MQILTIASIVTFILGLLGTIFTVYHYFKNPQIELDKKQAINDERDKNKATVADQEAVKNKTELLAQQFLSEKEDNNRRFTELGEALKSSMTLAQNHIHTVDTKVDALTKEVGCLENSITKLGTIIEERIPRKG